MTVSVTSTLWASEVSSLWWHCRAIIVVSVHLRRLTLAVSVTSALTTSEVSSLWWLILVSSLRTSLRRLTHSALFSAVSVHLRWLALAVSAISTLTTSEVSSLWWLAHSTLTVSDSIGSALQCYRLLIVTDTYLIFLSALKLITAIKYRIVALSLICRREYLITRFISKLYGTSRCNITVKIIYNT